MNRHSAGIGLAALVVFLLTLSNNHTEAEDALRYVVDVTRGDELFHPHHLLFAAVGRVAYQGWLALGLDGDALRPMQLLSAVSGAVAAALLHAICIRAGTSRMLAASVTLATAGSFGFWLYSVEAETYILPLPWILVAYGLLLTRPSTVAIPAASPAPACAIRVSLAALCLSFAALLHQQSVLYFFPAALLLWWQAEGMPAQQRLRAPVALLGLGGAACLGAYIWVAVQSVGVQSLDGFLNWMLGYASDGPWEPWSLKTPLMALIGLARALVGIHAFLGFEGLYSLAHDSFPQVILAEEHFQALRTAPAQRVLAFTALATSGVLAMSLLPRTLRHFFAGRGAQVAAGGRSPILLRVAIVAILVQAGFATAWEAYNPEFWIAVIPWLMLTVGLIIHRQRDRLGTWLFAGFAAALTVGNASGSILPMTDPKTDFWLEQTAPARSVAMPGDVWLTLGGYISDGYLSRHTGERVISATEPYSEVLERITLAAQRSPARGRLLVSSWIIDPPAGVRASRQLIRWKADNYRGLLDCYQSHLQPLLKSGDQTLWHLQGPLPDCRDTTP